MLAGLLLMAAALGLTGYNLWDDWRASASVEHVMEQMPEPAAPPAPLSAAADPNEVEIPDYLLNPAMEMPTVEVDGSAYIGTLEIPSLDISLPILSEWSDANLRIAPCRYSGTAYQGNFVIAGHNYRRHFGPLGRIVPGAEIQFTDVDGNRFRYSVVETQVLVPTAIEEMVADEWDLTLFTCTLGGRTRLTVRCEAVETELELPS